MRWEQLGQNFADLAKRRHEFEEIVDRLEMAAAGQRRGTDGCAGGPVGALG